MGLDSDDIMRGLVVIVVIKGLDSRCVKNFLYNENRKK